MLPDYRRLAMHLLLNGSLADYAENMSCVTLHKQLSAVCANESMAHTEECNKSAQGINLAVPIIMTTFGVVGNILALLVLYSSRKEAQARRTVFFVMLSGLAWTDLLCQIAVSPIAIITYANNLRWVGGNPLCNYHGFMMVSFGLVMPLIVCFMSLERLLAIKFSYFYARRVTRKKALLIFLGCWGFTLTFTCLPFIGVSSYELQYPGSWCFLKFHRENIFEKIYAGVFSSVNIIAIGTMIVSNLMVAATLCRMRVRRQLSNSPSLDRKLSLSGQYTPSSITNPPGTVIRMRHHSDMEAQMIWFLGMITVAFSVCWLPLNVHILLMQITGSSNCTLDLLVIRLAGINQILDPWLYVIFRKNSILRISRRISACFRPKEEPKRPYGMPPRLRITIDGTTVARTHMGLGADANRVCRHLIHGGADLIGESNGGVRLLGVRTAMSEADLLCSQCSLCDDGESQMSNDYNPLINLHLGSSPTAPGPPDGVFSFDNSTENIRQAELSANETDENEKSDKTKSEELSDQQSASEDKRSPKKTPLMRLKEPLKNATKDKLRWFLPSANSYGSDAFASYESTETNNSTRPGSIKSPHPISKHKIRPSKSLLGAATPGPGVSPGDAQRDFTTPTEGNVFIFPSPHSDTEQHEHEASLNGHVIPEASAHDFKESHSSNNCKEDSRHCSIDGNNLEESLSQSLRKRLLVDSGNINSTHHSSIANNVLEDRPKIYGSHANSLSTPCCRKTLSQTALSSHSQDATPHMNKSRTFNGKSSCLLDSGLSYNSDEAQSLDECHSQQCNGSINSKKPRQLSFDV